VTWQVVWVAVAALFVLALAISVVSSLFRGLVRQQARERELLLNQIMHLAGRTWQPPPVPADVSGADVDTVVITDPTQLPDY
jgi:hypothetical protein